MFATRQQLSWHGRLTSVRVFRASHQRRRCVRGCAIAPVDGRADANQQVRQGDTEVKLVELQVCSGFREAVIGQTSCSGSIVRDNALFSDACGHLAP